MAFEPLSGRIAVVGTGVIGASWAAYFLARGFDVVATNSADGGRRKLRFPRLSIIADGFQRYRTALKRALNPPH
jgi:3-hydroxyacyl-CoA dehydrogenase